MIFLSHTRTAAGDSAPRSAVGEGRRRAGLGLLLCLGATAALAGGGPEGTLGELKLKEDTTARTPPSLSERPELPTLTPALPRIDISAPEPDVGTDAGDVSMDLVPDLAIDLNVTAPTMVQPSGGGSKLPVRDESDLVLVRHVEPEYPREALLDRTEGWVQVEFTVVEDGDVEDVDVIAAEPPRIFNRAAVRAVKRWRYEPPDDGDGTTRFRTMRTIEFTLN